MVRVAKLECNLGDGGLRGGAGEDATSQGSRSWLVFHHRLLAQQAYSLIGALAFKLPAFAHSQEVVRNDNVKTPSLFIGNEREKENLH